MSTEGGGPGGSPGNRRRRHSPLAVASVAAAVLLAGGGGAYWATTASGGGGGAPPRATDATGTPPPLALDGYGRTSGSGGPSQGIAVGEPDPHGVRYRAEGKLPDGPRTGAVRVADREVTAGQVAALAKALGVPGTPRLVQDTWTVGGSPDAAGPTLQVGRKGPGDWAYSRYGVPGGAHCEHPPGAGPKKETGPESSPGPAPESSPGPACPSFRDGAPSLPPDPAASQPVPEDRAKSVAAPVLKALGLDGARTDARKTYGAVRIVTADPVVDSLPTYGWQTSLRVGADAQLVGGSGRLLLPAKGTSYPLVTADRALDELNKVPAPGTPAVGGCATPVPYKDDAAAPCEGKPAGPATVTVRGAVAGLSAQYVGGRPALVPSWLFTADLPGGGKGDTVTIAQPAVDPGFIARQSAPPPGGPAGTPGSGPAKSGVMRVESYTATDGGRKLVLHFWGGVCNDYTAAKEESGAAVTVKVTGTEKEPGRYCVMMLKHFDTTVTLDRPLDDRKVVDLGTGETVREQQQK
ncbi:hypothetical protein [Streptomyces sp. NPDC037389]|uniref:hypothetical protein n=1 Tax=Streptomyces sp. NPDC037389 TaxID=3155369 RepID=UPI0033CE36A2